MILPEYEDDDTPAGRSCNRQLASEALLCDRYHHYYHYQSSAQYLWLAQALRALGKEGEALAAYDRAIFQDHGNQQALAGKSGVKADDLALHYTKHPMSDAAFCISIGQPAQEATRLHDEAAALFLKQDYTQAKILLGEAIKAAPEHSNSFFLRGKCHFLQNHFEQASNDFSHALTFSHRAHDRYHKHASDAHLNRGKEYYHNDALELAVSAFTKALDLYKHNKEALKARALVYRKKGALRLAIEDEQKLMIL